MLRARAGWTRARLDQGSTVAGLAVGWSGGNGSQGKGHTCAWLQGPVARW